MKNLLIGVNSFEYGLQESNIQILKKKFKALRAEANGWHAQRTAYMMERLKAGRHPDTDKTFWNEWQEPPAPSLHVSSPQEMRNRQQHFLNFGIPVFGVLFFGLLLLRSAKKRKTAGS